jgi:hypothetical protein
MLPLKATMSATLPALHLRPGLRSASRLAGLLPERAGLIGELAILLLAGAFAACSVVLIDLNLRLPGHSILKAVLPITLGFAVAPRAGAGIAMSTGAFGMLAILRMFDQRSGIGAMTSLLALGPALDLLLARARPGWTIYLRFALGGLLANLLAFAVRGGGKALRLDSLSMRPLEDWLTVAPWTYAACGLAAGLVCSLFLFRAAAGRDDQAS